ncbi:FAD-containing subunit of NADH dehydrogenase [Poronia punctata]|nr:FAD-containing subunit of NADH dehydrogenase [Poronia punctata]
MSPQRIIIIGSGFAGFWAALSARRLITLNLSPNNTSNKNNNNNNKTSSNIEVIVIAPTANLILRPRLYEAAPEKMTESVEEIYRVCGIKFIPGTVDSIDIHRREISYLYNGSKTGTVLGYDKLVLAAGSRLLGKPEAAFAVDQFEDAVKLDKHLHSLAESTCTSTSPCKGRNTVVVCGGGFTGVEVAAELPSRLSTIFGPQQQPQQQQKEKMNVVLIERGSKIGPGDDGTTPYIRQALAHLNVRVLLNTGVASVDEQGVNLDNGERIETRTAIWTAGVYATGLTDFFEKEKRDKSGRLLVDEYLRVDRDVYVAGDAAAALADAKGGHFAKMSCQHAGPLGKIAGYNSAAEILGLPALLKKYEQPFYGVCLDLGSAGAVVGEGWDVVVGYSGQEGKKVKRFINTELIYPPKDLGDVEGILRLADPAFQGADEGDGVTLKGFLERLGMEV